MTEQEKMAARRKVANAVKAGRLIRPSHCPKCGSPDRKRSDGRSTIHAHHHKGYDHPLDVEWLCVRCHFQEDLRPAKSANGRAKLTDEQVAEIRRRYRPGINRHHNTDSCRSLAQEFGVHNRTVARIIEREIWIDAALGEGR